MISEINSEIISEVMSEAIKTGIQLEQCDMSSPVTLTSGCLVISEVQLRTSFWTSEMALQTLIRGSMS